MRIPHKLEPTGKAKIPRRYIFFDSEAETEIDITEADVWRASQGEDVYKEHVPYLVCATYYQRKTNRGITSLEQSRDYYGEDFLERFWTDVDKFARASEKLYMYAHNAKYDVLVLGCVHYMVKLGYQVEGFSDSNPFILRLRKQIGEDSKGKMRYKSIIILSSTNYFAQSLKSLGDIFGLPKLEVDYAKPETPEDWDTLLTYARRDVEILKTAVLSFIDFVDREGLGSLAMTVAGQAFNAFRQRFLMLNVYIHSNKEALEVERRAYAGGRNECFRMGRVPDYVYANDVNSMYPYVMAEKLYPIRMVTMWRRATLERVYKAIQDGYLVCLDARVNTDIPIYHQKGERLVFPVGDFWTSLSTPEVVEGFNRGMITEVKNVCLYEAGNIFEPYVRWFYKSRQEAKAKGDRVHDHLYKIFMNSLYGKFGQKNVKWERVEDADPEDIGVMQVYNGLRYVTVKTFGGGVFVKEETEDNLEAFNSFPAVAAHVTAYARMLLWNAMEKAGMENVFYCDTDSLFTNREGFERLKQEGLIDSKRLGALDMEKEGRLILHGAKDYVFFRRVTDAKEYRKCLPCPPYFRWFARQPCRLIYLPPRVVRRGELWKVEIKIKGVSKTNSTLLHQTEMGDLVFSKHKQPVHDQGVLYYAVTQWHGFAKRFREKDFKHYKNQVIIKRLNREYKKGTIDGQMVKPFVRDHDREAAEQAQREIEIARREIAIAAEQEDMFRAICLRYGYIRSVRPGERYYLEYQELPRKSIAKYFRRNGIEIDVWAEDNGLSVRELLEYLQ